MEYGAQIKSVSDVKSGFYREVNLVQSCYHNKLSQVLSQMGFGAPNKAPFICTSFDPRKLWLSASDLTSRRKKHLCIYVSINITTIVGTICTFFYFDMEFTSVQLHSTSAQNLSKKSSCPHLNISCIIFTVTCGLFLAAAREPHTYID